MKWYPERHARVSYKQETDMIKIRRSDDRGHTKLSWLDSRHTFSFGDYHDPEQMGFSALRVINEDRVIPGAGFPTHSHRDINYHLRARRRVGAQGQHGHEFGDSRWRVAADERRNGNQPQRIQRVTN